MTRTERATSLRAIVKDRSESKTGIDKHMPKNGAGTHNWGSLMDERELEEAAVYDEERDRESATEEAAQPLEPPRRKSSPSLNDTDRGVAREFRKNALKSPDLDLGAIARTSAAVSTSPTSTVAVASDADTTASP